MSEGGDNTSSGTSSVHEDASEGVGDEAGDVGVIECKSVDAGSGSG